MEPATVSGMTSARLLPVLVALLGAGAYAFAFPVLADGTGVPELAFVFALPWVLWAAQAPRWRVWCAAGLLAMGLAWFVMLFWLRHITFAGTLGLALVLGTYTGLWLAAVRWAVPRLRGAAFGVRLAGWLGLAGLWVVLEWGRTWLFSGFPWLPLAASQWERPVLLQPAAWTGAYGVSFLLIFFNLGLAAYLLRLADAFRRVTACEDALARKGREAAARQRPAWWQRIAPEFYLALGLLLGTFALFLHEAGKRADAPAWSFDAALVQPWTPAELKWDPARARENWDTLFRQTRQAAAFRPDAIFWPEAATPGWVINKQGEGVRRAIERLVRETGSTLIMGNLAETGAGDFNGVFVVEPGLGLREDFYGKSKLVPFGEYIPFRDALPFDVDKVVPVGGDFTAGNGPRTLTAAIDGREFRFGPLVCYEDIFPQFARGCAAQGARFHAVVTNNAWYGEEAGAYQHAAHSVLRAVETRRPVVRCGNHGWSGWIDERGGIQGVLRGENGRIYLRGAAAFTIEGHPAYAGSRSLYTRWGDWFVALCGLLAAAGAAALARRGLPQPGAPG